MTEENSPKINYCLYARKSSEAEDRQVLSIDAQVEEMKQMADRNGFGLSEVKKESKSAKAPGRPIFDEMIKDIEKGKIQSIVVWHPDRLSRNSMDTGKIIYLLDLEKLKEIVTPSQIFRNTPNDKFLFSLLCSQAKLENDNKSINVKRGLRKKAEMGYPSGVAKIGYLNDKTGTKGEKIWYEDQVRFPLVKQMFEKFLSGKFSVQQLGRFIDKELILTTPQRKKLGGKPISRSYLYNMLADPIYAGFFYQGEKDMS